MVIALSGGTFVMVMQEHYPTEVKSLIMPTVLVCLIAAAVSIMFFEVSMYECNNLILKTLPSQISETTEFRFNSK